GLDDPPGRALPRESQRLTAHDWIVFVRPLIEFLNLVPKLGFVIGTTRPKPRGRDPLIIHPEVVLFGFAADVGVDSSTLHLRWTASAGPATRNWKRGATPVSCHIGMAVGQPRGYGGCDLRRRRRWWVGSPEGPVGRLNGWLDRRLDACGNRHYDIHLRSFCQ